MTDCACGCGRDAGTYTKTQRSDGAVKGAPKRFVYGHSGKAHRDFADTVDIRPDEGCWVWLGHKNRGGYGQLFIYGKNRAAHRAFYEAFVGPIPEGLTIDHLCRNPSCVNPAHLEPVTMRENVLRGEGFVGVNARKTHCKHGHLFDEANTYITPEGHRICRPCQRGHYKAYRRRKKEKQSPLALSLDESIAKRLRSMG